MPLTNTHTDIHTYIPICKYSNVIFLLLKRISPHSGWVLCKNSLLFLLQYPTVNVNETKTLPTVIQRDNNNFICRKQYLETRWHILKQMIWLQIIAWAGANMKGVSTWCGIIVELSLLCYGLTKLNLLLTIVKKKIHHNARVTHSLYFVRGRMHAAHTYSH